MSFMDAMDIFRACIFLTLWLWFPLSFMFFVKAIEKKRKQERYRLFLGLSIGFLEVCVCLPFLTAIENNTFATTFFRAGSGFGNFFIAFGSLTFWLWPYLLLSNGITVISHIDKKEPIGDYAPALVSAFMIIFLFWCSSIYR